MPGVNGATQIVTNNNGTFSLVNIGNWVDGLIQNPPQTIETPDAATKRVPLDTLNLTILATDENGNIDYHPIVSASQITVASLTTPVDIVSFHFETGSTRIFTADTYIPTRINNQIIGQQASDFAVGDQVLRGLRRHILTGAPPNYVVKEVDLPTVDSQPVPHVVTVNWGEQNFSRADCQNLLDSFQQDPNLDQADIPVLTAVINENTYYDFITNIEAGTASKLYDIETDSGVYQLYSGLNISHP